jgi:hypothetical protein
MCLDATIESDQHRRETIASPTMIVVQSGTRLTVFHHDNGTMILYFPFSYHKIKMAIVISPLFFVRSMISDDSISHFGGTGEQNLRERAVGFGISKTSISMTWNFDESAKILSRPVCCSWCMKSGQEISNCGYLRYRYRNHVCHSETSDVIQSQAWFLVASFWSMTRISSRKHCQQSSA